MLISPAQAERLPHRSGFTLVEVLVAAGLSGAILAGVLGTSVHLMRSNVSVAQYSEMDTQVRRAFEQMAVDLKGASNVTWNSESDITVTIPGSIGASTQFTYAWNSTTRTFYRVPGASSSAAVPRVSLIHGIPSLADGTPGLRFARLTRTGAAAANDAETKSIQINVTLKRDASGPNRASSTVSATFTLRNKPVS